MPHAYSGKRARASMCSPTAWSQPCWVDHLPSFSKCPAWMGCEHSLGSFVLILKSRDFMSFSKRSVFSVSILNPGFRRRNGCIGLSQDWSHGCLSCLSAGANLTHNALSSGSLLLASFILTYGLLFTGSQQDARDYLLL